MALTKLTVEDDLAHLTLDRPDKRNALSEELILDAIAALETASQEGARALVLDGSGPAFCAGGDVDWMRERIDDPDATRKALQTRLNVLVDEVATFPAPTVAAVQGAAIGAGLGLALACDLTIVEEDAVLGATHARLGLTPDAGTTWILTQTLGPKRAIDLVLNARTFSGSEAADWGLASDAVPDDELDEVARRQARKLAAGPTQAYRMARQLVRDAARVSLHEMLDREAEAQAAMYRTEDQTEGVTAFLEDREPRFSGR